MEEKNRRAYSRLIDRQIDEIIGMAKGVIADGVVTQEEAEYLLEWLQTNRYAADKWPANVLYNRLSLALADGVLDSDEESDLLQLISDIVGKPKHTDAHSMTTTLPFNNPMPHVEFSDRTFCLTGTFYGGKRKILSQMIERRGGEIKNSPSRFLNYLVIGEVGSMDWIHSTFGRKIEKAVELRDQGHSIAIISEEHWSKYI